MWYHRGVFSCTGILSGNVLHMVGLGNTRKVRTSAVYRVSAIWVDILATQSHYIREFKRLMLQRVQTTDNYYKGVD